MDLASTKKLAEKMGSKFGDAYGPLLPNFKFRAFITRSSKVTGELLLWLYGSVETVESLVRSVGEQALLVQALQIQVDQLQNVKRNNKEPAAEQLEQLGGRIEEISDDGLSEMELSINEAVKTKNQTKARGELERFKTKVQSEVESLQAKAQNLEDL
ncbi:hypothetical protein HDU99_010500, partial [Rhizoclosmatium hyalinum]